MQLLTDGVTDDVAMTRMRKLFFEIVLGATATILASAESAETPRIGVLLPAARVSASEVGLRGGLREQGYVEGREYHEHGALLSYGPDYGDVMRRAASYIIKILTGARPANLPVEEISKFDLVIDLRVAREMNIEVPQSLLLRADELIR